MDSLFFISNPKKDKCLTVKIGFAIVNSGKINKMATGSRRQNCCNE